MLKFRNEEGLTLIELLVVIALVGIVAAISLPILLNTVTKAQTKADTNTTANVDNFKADWTTAGFELVQGVVGGGTSAKGLVAGATDPKVIYAVDVDGDNSIQAQIKGTL